MFNSTHTLVGLALARTGWLRQTPRAAWTAVIASNLPDVDIITQFAGTATYLDYHRGITHSIVGIPILCLMLAGVRYLTTHTFWNHFRLALIVMATHPLLDWANTYGVRPFLPFSAHWYYGDTLFVIDPYLDGILLIGVLLSSRLAKRGTRVAALSLVAACLYVGGMIGLRERALREFSTYVDRVPGVVKTTVGPEFLNPFRWVGYVETIDGFSSATIDLSKGSLQPLPEVSKSPESDITRAAESTYTAQVFRRFARFPVTRVAHSSTGYRVLLIDLRFLRYGDLTISTRAPQYTALSAQILLDDKLHVLSQSISFARPID